MTQYPDASSGYISDVSTCWSLCLQLVLNGKECVAAVLESSTTVCKLYLGTELLSATGIQTVSSAGSTVMLRTCFQGKYGSNVMPGPQDAEINVPLCWRSKAVKVFSFERGWGQSIHTHVSPTTKNSAFLLNLYLLNSFIHSFILLFKSFTPINWRSSKKWIGLLRAFLWNVFRPCVLFYLLCAKICCWLIRILSDLIHSEQIRLFY